MELNKEMKENQINSNFILTKSTTPTTVTLNDKKPIVNVDINRYH